MNKKQRKELSGTIDRLYVISNMLSDEEYFQEEEWKNDLENIVSELENMRDEENDKVDNLPESLQFSSKADEYQDCIDNLDYVIDSLGEAQEYEDPDEVEDEISNAISYIEEVVG